MRHVVSMNINIFINCCFQYCHLYNTCNISILFVIHHLQINTCNDHKGSDIDITICLNIILRPFLENM